MKRTNSENKTLYESIMRDVAVIVKKRLNEDSNAATDPRVVVFGPSFTMGELKSHSAQKKVYDKLCSLYGTDSGFQYTNGKFVINIKIENVRTDETGIICAVFNTVYEAAIITDAIMNAVLTAKLPENKFMLHVDLSGFYEIRKKIKNKLNDAEVDKSDELTEKMVNYLNTKLSGDVTFKNVIEEIGKCINLANKPNKCICTIRK